MAKLKTKTTKKDFEFFCTCCAEYIDKLKLGDWHVVYKHADLREHSFAASCEWHIEHRYATLTLATYWGPDNPITDNEIRRSALHEVLHLLLADMHADMELSTNTVNKLEHQIIVRLTNWLCSSTMQMYESEA